MAEVKKVYVAGATGMVGSSLIRALSKKNNIKIFKSNSSSLDLRDSKKTYEFFLKNKFDQVYLAAAKVGGIYANDNYPADFIRDNLSLQVNVIHSAFLTGVKKLLFFGSSCIYPRSISSAIKENMLLSDHLELTNEPYAIAKISGIKMCESYNRQHNTDYRSIMPTNLYGPNDNYYDKNSHVIPALISRFHNAKVNKLKEVKVWGSGLPKREFLHVDDLASAAIFVMNLSKKKYNSITNERCTHINVGYGSDISIGKLTIIIKDIVGYEGKIIFDKSMKDGTKRKLLSSDKLFSLGWHPKYNLNEGISLTYEFFKRDNQL